MTTYIYESIPKKAGQKPHRYELMQSMKDAPYTKHPETGEPIRRIVLGGFGYTAKTGKGRPPNWELMEKGPVYDKDPHDHGHEHMHDHH